MTRKSSLKIKTFLRAVVITAKTKLDTSIAAAIKEISLCSSKNISEHGLRGFKLGRPFL
jgi:hypothetical protein